MARASKASGISSAPVLVFPPNRSNSFASSTLKPFSAQSSFEKIKVLNKPSFCQFKYVLLIVKLRFLVDK